MASGKLNPNYLPKLAATRPVCEIGPFPAWSDPSKIGTMDPWGHLVTDVSLVSFLLLLWEGTVVLSKREFRAVGRAEAGSRGELIGQ